MEYSYEEFLSIHPSPFVFPPLPFPQSPFSLHSLLSEDNLGASNLETIAAAFHHAFTRQDHFRVGMALVSLAHELFILDTLVVTFACTSSLSFLPSLR